MRDGRGRGLIALGLFRDNLRRSDFLNVFPEPAQTIPPAGDEGLNTQAWEGRFIFNVQVKCCGRQRETSRDKERL